MVLRKSCRFGDDEEDVGRPTRRRPTHLGAGRRVVGRVLGCLGAWSEAIPRPATRVLGSKPSALEGL